MNCDLAEARFLVEGIAGTVAFSPVRSPPVFMFFGKKKSQHDMGCMTCHLIVGTLLSVVTIAAAFGVVYAHLDFSRQVIALGTPAGSQSLIAFAICMACWMKHLKSCMGKCDVCMPSKK